MAKKKKRPRRTQQRAQSGQYQSICGFCLPDTPENRAMLDAMTGGNAARYSDGAGSLEGTVPIRQRNSGDCEAVKLQSPPII